MLKLQACKMTKAIVIKYLRTTEPHCNETQYWKVGLQITGFCDYKRDHIKYNRGLSKSIADTGKCNKTAVGARINNVIIESTV